MSKKSELAWFQMPQGDSFKSKLRKVAMRTDQPFSRVESWQLAIQASAQNLNRGGEFEIDRTELAFNDRVDEETVDKVLRAFEAPDVALIVDGRCATFVERGQTKDQKRHATDRAKKAERERLAREAAAADADAAGVAAANGVAPPRGAGAPHFDPRAPRDTPNAAREAPESSESSLRTTERIEILPSVVVESPARESTTTTDQEIVELISGIDPSKLPKTVVVAGVVEIRKWLAAGYDLRADILPELEEIAAKSAKPVRTLRAGFIPEQLRERRDRRMTPAAEARPPPLGRSNQSSKPLTGAQIRGELFYGKFGANGHAIVNGLPPFALPRGRAS